MLEMIFWTTEDVVEQGLKVYEQRIRALVEIPENIGKMLTLDVETGEYKIGMNSIEGAIELKQNRPMARLFTLRIGHDVGVSFGGLSERTVK
jgi:phenylalanyl-tRNA synthetase beta subunit